MVAVVRGAGIAVAAMARPATGGEAKLVVVAVATTSTAVPSIIS